MSTDLSALVTPPDNVVQSTSTYSATHIYTLYVNPENRHIVGMIGGKVAAEQLNDGNNFPSYCLTDMTEDEYQIVKMSINSTECMTFLDVDNRTIIVRRVCVDLLDNTFFDAKANKIYGVDNIVKLRIRCVDNTLTHTDDVTEIIIKNVKKGRQPMSFNGMDPDVYKTTVTNPAELTVELLGDGVHTIKVKATLPTVQYLWLTAYPQMLALTDEQNADLKKYLATSQT